jgi:hypothetical protein
MAKHVETLYLQLPGHTPDSERHFGHCKEENSALEDKLWHPLKPRQGWSDGVKQ